MQVRIHSGRHRNIHTIEKLEASGATWVIKLNVGERIFEFKTTYSTEATRWAEAMQLAKATALERLRSKTGKSRNISKTVEQFRSSKEGLQQSLQASALALLPEGKKWGSAAEILEACGKVKDEFIVVLGVLTHSSSTLAGVATTSQPLSRTDWNCSSRRRCTTAWWYNCCTSGEKGRTRSR